MSNTVEKLTSQLNQSLRLEHVEPVTETEETLRTKSVSQQFHRKVQARDAKVGKSEPKKFTKSLGHNDAVKSLIQSNLDEQKETFKLKLRPIWIGELNNPYGKIIQDLAKQYNIPSTNLLNLLQEELQRRLSLLENL